MTRTPKTVRGAVFLLAMALTALLALGAPRLADFIQSPPAAPQAQRQLITVWLAGEMPGAAAWLHAQAAAYSKKHPGARIWLRTVSAQDVAGMDGAPPDLLLFDADTAAPAGEAVLLCLSGYVLAAPAEAAVTPAPRSLFGVSPTPDPAQTPAPSDFRWPPTFAADDGFGALALAALNAPPWGTLVKRAALPGMLLDGQPALLTIAQARALQARGVALRLLAASPATDLALYGMACRDGEPAADFLRYLTSREAQQGLAAQSLISILPGLRLYGDDRPLLQALEAALSDGWRAPAFRWPREKRELILTAQALYAAGQSAAGLLAGNEGL